jgi:hypothetical protein
MSKFPVLESHPSSTRLVPPKNGPADNNNDDESKACQEPGHVFAFAWGHLFFFMKSPAGLSGSGFPFILVIGLVNDAEQIIADPTHNGHGRDGPKQQCWHFRLLLSHLCPRQSSAGKFPLVPEP